jgi:hypothetical protein
MAAGVFLASLFFVGSSFRHSTITVTHMLRIVAAAMSLNLGCKCDPTPQILLVEITSCPRNSTPTVSRTDMFRISSAPMTVVVACVCGGVGETLLTELAFENASISAGGLANMAWVNTTTVRDRAGLAFLLILKVALQNLQVSRGLRTVLNGSHAGYTSEQRRRLLGSNSRRLMRFHCKLVFHQLT